MAYVESFARAMERARASVSYWDRKTLDHLQAAHDAEVRQCSRDEYHRGFEDGKAVRDADQWQLDRERAEVAGRLREVEPSLSGGSHDMLSTICRAVYGAEDGWTVGAGKGLISRLLHLLGEDHANDFQPQVYDTLSNERHKAVCELRKIQADSGGFVKALASAIGIDWMAPRVNQTLAEVRDRLIHLLGGDEPTLSDLYGIWSEDDKSDECNFSGAESYMGADGRETNPAETPTEPSDHVSFGTQPITSEQREYADDYCYRGHFFAFKSDMTYPMPWDNPAETSEDAVGTTGQPNGTCPNNVPTPSITDELRKFAETFRYEWYDEKDGSVCYTTSDMPPTIDSVNGADYINGIADRIDQQFDRICLRQESVLQQTVNEMCEERDELRRKLDAIKGIVDGS